MTEEYKPIEKQKTQNRSLIYAIDNDQELGCIHIVRPHEGDNVADLTMQYVSQELRGKGYVRKLQSVAFVELARIGITKVDAHIPEVYNLNRGGELERVSDPSASHDRGGYRSAKSLFFPRFEDGTGIVSRINKLSFQFNDDLGLYKVGVNVRIYLDQLRDSEIDKEEEIYEVIKEHGTADVLTWKSGHRVKIKLSLE